MVPIHFQEQGLPTAYHRYIRTSSALAASKRLSGSTRTEAGAPASLDKQNGNGGEVRVNADNFHFSKVNTRARV